MCLIRKDLKCDWNSNGTESASNGSKECFFPWENLVLGYQVGSLSGPEYLWNSDPVSGAEMQHSHTWEL